jgi:cyclic pyranopterin phosphate synthase
MLAAIQGISDLALTTNGTLLAGKARALREAGLSRVTVSLDSLDEDVFRDERHGRAIGAGAGGIAAAHALPRRSGHTRFEPVASAV